MQDRQSLPDHDTRGRDAAAAEAAGAKRRIRADVSAGDTEGGRGLADRADDAEDAAVLQILHGQTFDFRSPDRAVLVGFSDHDRFFHRESAGRELVPVPVVARDGVDHVVAGGAHRGLLHGERAGRAVVGRPESAARRATGRKAQGGDGSDCGEGHPPQEVALGHGGKPRMPRQHTIAMKRTYCCDYKPIIYICQ